MPVCSGPDLPQSAAMSAEPIVVAVYGTLRRGERNAPFLARARFLGTGLVRGRLLEIPQSGLRPYAYPALVLDGDGAIVVEVYEVPDAAALADLDRLEACDPLDEPGSEYVRRDVPVMDGPTDHACVWVYNGPADAIGEAIPGGDWVAHCADARPD